MGTVAQKIAYLNETKELIKESLNTNFNSQIEDTDTFRSYISKISDLYINWPKVEGEGTNLTLNNTRKGKMSNVLEGNTSQNSTTGKNLFDSSLFTASTVQGITLTKNSDGTIKLDGTTTARSDFVITNLFSFVGNNKVSSINRISGTNNGDVTFGLYDSNWANGKQCKITSSTNSENIALSSETTYTKCFIRIETGVTLTNLTIGLQVEDDSTATEWEPFTGNQPAPNPSYPERVQVVSGDNTIKVENAINVFDISNYATNNSSYYSYSQQNGLAILQSDSRAFSSINGKYNVDTNTKYYVKCDNTVDIVIAEYTSSDSWIKSNDITTNSEFTTANNTSYFKFKVRQTRITYPYTIGKIYVSKSSNYVSQTYPISLGNIELCKIGDYQDYIYKENNKWYKHSEIGKVVLDGSESGWDEYTQSGVTNYYNNSLITFNTQNGLSNYFTLSTDTSYTNTNTRLVLFNSQKGFGIYAIQNLFGTLASLKGWLSNNNPTVYYVLVTPTNTEITDQTLIAQLDNFEKVKSYNSQTNISQENNDLPFIIDATALMGNSD